MIRQRITDYFQDLDQENNEDIERLINQEYGVYVKMFAIFPSLKPDNLIYTILQVLIFLAINIYHMILLAYSVILVSSDITLFSICFHYFLLISLNSALSVLAIINRKHLCRMYRLVNDNFFDYKEGEDDEYVISVKDKAKKIKYIFSFLPVYILFTGIALVTVGPLIDDADSNESSLSVEGLNLRLPVIKWYPYSTEDDLPYYITLLGQAAIAAHVAGVIGTYDLIYVTITQELCVQLHILNHSLINLKRRAKNKFKEIYGDINDCNDYINDDRFHRCYYHCIRQNIIHHQIIIEYFKECQSFSAIPGLLAYGTATIVIALAMYEISMGTRKLGTGITSGLLVVGEIVSAFVLSYFGEMVTTLSLQVRESLYSTNWFQCSNNRYIKNLVTVIQERTKRPLIFSCIFTKINLDSFATVMNGAYSYLNLLSASKKS